MNDYNRAPASLTHLPSITDFQSLVDRSFKIIWRVQCLRGIRSCKWPNFESQWSKVYGRTSWWMSCSYSYASPKVHFCDSNIHDSCMLEQIVPGHQWARCSFVTYVLLDWPIYHRSLTFEVWPVRAPNSSERPDLLYNFEAPIESRRVATLSSLRS